MNTPPSNPSPTDTPDRLRFVFGQALEFEETRTVEFKENKGPNPVASIINTADDYAVAFLNSEGGQILWGIRDSDHVVVGVRLTLQERDELRKQVMNKLRAILPHLDPTRCRLDIHPVTGGSAPPEAFVVVLSVPKGNSGEAYFTQGNKFFVRLDGAKQKLNGPQLTAWIKARLKASLLSSSSIDDPEVTAFGHRIRRVFTAHGVETGHIPRFLKTVKAPFGIDFSDLQTDTAFLRWLTDEKINWIAKTFLIRREWIDGEDDQIYDCEPFDKQPKRFIDTVSEHVDALDWEEVPASPDAFFIRWGKGKEWTKKTRQGVFVVVAVPLARLSSERIIYKYLSDFDSYPWNYGRTNVQLRAWARLLTINKHISCRSFEMSYRDGVEFEANRVFPYELIEVRHALTRIDWYPEDYAL